MFLGAFLIGLREGMEAALIIGILVAFVQKRRVTLDSNQPHPGLDKPAATRALHSLWWGVGAAVFLSATLGAIFTFGTQTLTFQAQEIIGGSMSLLAVALVTWMVFWMAAKAPGMRRELEGNAATAMAGAMSMFWLAFITVGREGIETTFLLWGWTLQPGALLGALLGILSAAALGWLIYRGMIRLNMRVFFFWTGLFLVIVAAGILAYGIHDLQEAGVVPGPFSGAPITPTDFRTGEVLTGFFTPIPYWGAAFPFGWAFNVSDAIVPDGPLGALLKGTVGFTPQMSWLEVTAWFIYLVIVLPRFIRKMKNKPSERNHKNEQKTELVGDSGSHGHGDVAERLHLQPQSASLSVE